MASVTEKERLRATYYAIREREEKKPERAEAVRGALLAWLMEQKAKTIGIYWPVRAEIDIRRIAHQWAKEDADRCVALPVVDDKKKGLMHYAPWAETDPLQPMAYAIPAPCTPRRVSPDIIFAPCVAFNRAGIRLGNGGGFFDRYIAQRKESGIPLVTVAVAYEALECKALQADEFDLPFDFVVTQAGVSKCHS